MIRRYFFALLFWAAAIPAQAQTGFPSFADLAEKLLPSVVNISTIQQPETLEIFSGQGAKYFDPVEGRLALGSGFIIDNDGYIITNYHVIENAQSINVVLFDNTEVEADIIGADEKTDIALIKIDPPFELDKVKFGNSDNLRVGDWILAIGNPFGLGGSVSAGIVSAKSRDIAAGPYDNFIQTDASINQGSSGGPMFNMQGEVIGINTAIFSATGASTGVGFAIPINLASWIVAQLEQNGEVKRSWIGIKIQPNDKDTARDLNLKDNQGVIVSSLAENGPAAQAGILVGDAILSIGEYEISNVKDFSRMVAETPVGTDLHLIIWRNQEVLPLTVKTANMPKAPSLNSKKDEEKPSENDKIVQNIGISLRELTPEFIKKYKLPPTIMGLLVDGVDVASDAAQKGVKRGDIVVKIDQKEVATTEAALGYIEEAKMENNRPVILLLQNPEHNTINVVSVKLRDHE